MYTPCFWHSGTSGVLVRQDIYANVGYAFSPIDLIPDFIPVLGQLDDLLLIPVGVYVTMKLIPEDTTNDLRAKAQSMMDGNKPTSWIAGGIVVTIWILALVTIILRIVQRLRR